MHKLTSLALILCGVLASATALDSFDELDTDVSSLDPRFLFVNATGSLLPINGQLLLAAIGFLAVLVMFGIGIWLLVTGLSSKLGRFDRGSYGGGYGGGLHGGYDHDSYSEYQARSADPYSAIWEKMSVLDWIAMMEEMYRKFDATSMECQQRLVCELHQNENTWGNTARKMNDAFSYLQYLELLNLPAEVRVLLDDYLDAANKGRTSQQTCEEMYKGCEFSVKSLINKYNGSNAI